MRLLLVTLIFGGMIHFQGQILKKNTAIPNDTIVPNEEIVKNKNEKDSLKIFRPTILDYQIFTENGERKHLDTVLTHDKTFVFTQYNHQNNFGRIPFSNIGAGFNPLIFKHHPLNNLAVLPTNKSYFLLAPKDIRYYDVKTPTTSFIYHNGVNNGVALTSTYTQNFRKNFNISAQYMGLRSLGDYSNQLAVSNHVLFTTHYKSKNEKYQLFAHFLDQNIRNQENGGIQDNALFLSGASTISNRANLLTRLQDANTRFSMRRYYLSHQLAPFNDAKIPFHLKHIFNYQLNKYYYGEPAPQNFYYTHANELINYPTNTGKYSNNFSNALFLVWDNEKFKLNAGVRHQWIQLGFADALETATISLPFKKSEQRIGAVGNLSIRLWDLLHLHSNAEISRGSLLGNYFSSEHTVKLEPIPNYWVEGHIHFQSAYPSLNLMFNASPYAKHAYFYEHLKHENRLSVGGTVAVPWFNSKIYGHFKNVGNYTYLDAQGIPQQATDILSIGEVGGETTLKYRNFYFNTRLHFQKVLSSSALLPLPEMIARANIFYQSKVLKNAAEIQTGMKVHYFNSFLSRAYFPLLNEFQLSDIPFAVGGKPVVDVYFNFKVKRMFIFIEGQNILTTFTQNKNYTAPNYPFQDFRLNLGIVWYLVH